MFGLTTLSTRRLRYDLITVYKILHGLIELNVDDFFDLDHRPTYNTRGNSFKLKIRFSRLSSRSFFFSNRVISWWNKLSDDCVNSPSTASFKLKIDHFLNEEGLW